MSIEEAENILNEAVITEPSISSYTYISADEINEAINKILEEKLKSKNRIKELEDQIIEQKNKLEKLILEKETQKNNYPICVQTNRKIHFKRIIGYMRKIVPALVSNVNN